MEKQILSTDNQLSEEEIRSKVEQMKKLYLEVSNNPETREEIKRLRNLN